MVDPARPLVRTQHDRMIAGVCSGLAAWAGWDRTVVRVLVVFITLVTGVGPGIIGYLALALIMPLEGSERARARFGEPNTTASTAPAESDTPSSDPID